MSRVFDYVIVGGGTAGCLLANRLSKIGTVALLEAGGSDKRAVVRVPVGYLKCIGNPRTDFMYTLEPEPGLGGRQLRYPRGRVLGGCSSINGMIYMRGNANNYEEWAEMLGSEAWRWNVVLQDFKKHESHWNDASGSPLHGYGGEWRVEKQRVRWDVLDAFSKAAQEWGIPATSDFNGGDNEGVAYFEVNQKRGTRWNTARAFLAHVPDNLKIWKQCFVDRVEIDDACRARAVILADGSRVEARKEIILSAGSIQSPAILERSGIGDKARLSQLGISSVVDNSHVGENMCDHLQLRMVFKMGAGRSLNTMSYSWISRLGMGLQYLFFQSGPLSMSPSQLGAFTRSDKSQPIANLQYHVQPLSLDRFGDPLHRFDALTVSVCNLQPTSRGSSHIVSRDPITAPSIRANYLTTEADQQVAVDAIRVSRAICAQSSMAPYRLTEYSPGPDLETRQDLVRAAGQIGTTIFHPTSTCAMGKVLDDKFRVLGGVKALRVCDASAMPKITSGNTCSPVLMMAEKCAAWVIEENK